MSEPQDIPQQQPVASKSTSPTPSPPSGTEQSEAELKFSRKRNRDTSLEPVSSPSAPQGTDTATRERKDSRVPAKKNRRRLDPTTEEDPNADNITPGSPSRSQSASPPLNVMVTPRAEMKIKVRQISQGVGELNWTKQQSDEEMHEETAHKGEGLLESAPVIEKSEPIVVDAQDTQLEEEALSAPPTQPTEEEPVPAATQPTEDAPVKAADSTLRPDSGEKGLKRKYLERGTSAGPPEESPNGPESSQKTEKADSPTPESKPNERTSPPSPKIPKLSGFMAYASTSSPFANVKGNALTSASSSGSSTPNALSSSRSGFEAFAGASSPFASVSREKSPLTNNNSQGPNVAAPAPKPSGFASFSGAASPFAGVTRSKSPALGSTSKLGRAKSPPRRNSTLNANPFGSYASVGASGFSAALQAPKKLKGEDTHLIGVFGGGESISNVFGSRTGTVTSVFGSQKKQEDDEDEDDGDGGDDETQTSTFGERLRAASAGDDEDGEDGKPKMNLAAQDVVTGEEDEETILQVRGKLFALDETSWKERGTGIIRLNVKRADGSCPRLVMRKDAVYTLLLNVTLFPGMKCVAAQDPRYVRFSVIENGKTTHYNLKVSNQKIATEFLEEVNANIPSAEEASSVV